MFVFFSKYFFCKFIRAIYWPVVFFFVEALPVLCIRVLLSLWMIFRSARSFSSPSFPSSPSSSCLLLVVLLLETGFHYVALELCNPGAHIVVQVVLRLTEIHLHLLPNCWCQRCVPLFLGLCCCLPLLLLLFPLLLNSLKRIDCRSLRVWQKSSNSSCHGIFFKTGRLLMIQSLHQILVNLGC